MRIYINTLANGRHVLAVGFNKEKVRAKSVEALKKFKGIGIDHIEEGSYETVDLPVLSIIRRGVMFVAACCSEGAAKAEYGHLLDHDIKSYQPDR